MPLREKIRLEVKARNRPKQIRMTIAIACRATDGVLLYADKKIIASDGATTEGCKIYRSKLAKDGFIALASATNDGIAAEALAVDLIAHAKGEKDQSRIWGAIQTAMVNWCAPYPSGELPDIQYLMALRTSSIARTFLLQVRNQIIPIPFRRAIGAGSRIVDAIIEDVLPDLLPVQPKAALFSMAYMARKAKDQEYKVGGGSRSNAIYLPDKGRVRWIDETELWLAEELASTIDERLSASRRMVMSLGYYTPAALEKSADSLRNWMIKEATSLADKMEFKSLAH
jgi:hypothetical protein